MQAVQGILGRLCRYLSAYKPELFCAVPLALLVLFGFFSAPWWAYAVVLIILAMMVIICNPFHVWDRVLPPKSRLFMSAGILIGLLPVSFYGVELSAKLILWAIAVGLWAMALYRRKLWLGLYLIRQSAEVDTVLSHLSHEGDWQAGRAWEKYGCRETRALLHQTLWAECKENEMQRTYMPVYFLGFLHGEAAVANKAKRTEAEQVTVNKLEYQIEQLEAENEELIEKNSNLSELFAEEKERSTNAIYKAKKLEQHLNDLTLPQAEKDAAILACVQAGSTLEEAGNKYGLSKSGASLAVKRAKQAAQNKD